MQKEKDLVSSGLANFIYTTLKKEILTLSLVPGQGLQESMVCRRFKASRTPVHTALLRLSDEHLLDIVPYKEDRVSKLSVKSIRQTIYMRSVLESQVIKDFVDVADDMALEDCYHQLRRQDILLGSKDFTAETFFALDSAFHKFWFDKLLCSDLWDLIQKSEACYTRFRMMDIVEAHDYFSILDEHKQLVSLIENKDKENISELVTYHLLGGFRRLGEELATKYVSYFEDPDNLEEFAIWVGKIQRP
ncbi:MAG: GntR family transcriptional regulator [Sphaerochaetaceae bacterium]